MLFWFKLSILAGFYVNLLFLFIFVLWNQCLASEEVHRLTFDAVAQLTGQYHDLSTLHRQRL